MIAAVKRLLTGGGEPAPQIAQARGPFARFAFWRRTPRPIPAHLTQGGPRVQLTGDGHGPLFHRRYSVVIARPKLSAEALMGQIKADVAAFAPRLLADFKKTKGAEDVMRPGDEYHITILGPWNGSVRVIEETPTSFTLITLEGHPEAGEISFSLDPHPSRPGTLCFEICSWARSRDMIVGLTYKEAGVGKEMQKNAWVAFCERVAEASGGRQVGEATVVTEEHRFEGEVIPIE